MEKITYIEMSIEDIEAAVRSIIERCSNEEMVRELIIQELNYPYATIHICCRRVGPRKEIDILLFASNCEVVHIITNCSF